MDFSTPWDDLDLDIMTLSHVPRLKLPTPGFYFALLPLDSYSEDLETKWQNAENACEKRLVAARCIEYERRILNKIASYKLGDSSSIAAAIEAQKQIDQPPQLAFMKEAIPVTDQSRYTRKRGRAAKSEVATPTRRSKRIRFAKDRKDSSALRSPPTSPPAMYVPLQVTTTTINGRIDKTPPSKERFVSSQRSPKFNPFNNPNSSANFVDIHQKIYCAVDAWHDLILQAEALEHNLLATKSQSEVTISSVRQSAMSKDQLEELYAKIQDSVTEVIEELDAAAMSAFTFIGIRSPSMIEFKSVDPRRKEILLYDFELEWQMKEFGLFAWWLHHFNDVLR